MRLRKLIFVSILILFSNLCYSGNIDYMRVQLQDETFKSYKIEDVRKLTFPNIDEMAIVPYRGEIILYPIDKIVKVLFVNIDNLEDILYVNEDLLTQENSIYSAIIIAKEGNSNIDLDIQDNHLSASRVAVFVDENGVAPRINILGSGFITANKFVVHRKVKGDVWTMMSLPFDVNISDIMVEGAPVVIGENLLIREYDGEKRALNSVQNATASGWVAKNKGVIPADKGFAVAINSRYEGDIQEVVFPSPDFDSSISPVEAVQLERHYSAVNNGIDADWNFVGNPNHSFQLKQQGYSAYVYDSATDSYEEYSSSQVASFWPYQSFFVQSGDNLTEIIYVPFYESQLKSLSDIEVAELNINGEDKLSILVNSDADNGYVKNEDALYMEPNNSALSQIYMIQNGIKMAVSEQPSLAEDILIGYKAPKGNQSITVSRLPENVTMTIVDKLKGEERVLFEGDDFEFNNTTTTNNNRFILKFAEFTGLYDIEADDYMVYISGNRIFVEGTSEGEEVSLYSSNGMLLQKIKSQTNITILETIAQGVLVVKVEDKVYKVVKK